MVLIHSNAESDLGCILWSTTRVVVGVEELFAVMPCRQGEEIRLRATEPG